MKYTNRTTPDGMTWLDDSGKPPHVNEEGGLTRPFRMTVQYDSTDRVEHQLLGVGAILPKTPAASAQQASEIRAKADAAVAADWQELEARQQADINARNAKVEKDRQLAAAVREATPPRPTVTDPGAVTGNTQGGTVAVDSPAKSSRKKPSSKPSTRSAAVKGSAATKPAGKPQAKAPVSDGQPSKPASGLVYLRRMRSPREAFILIKNPSVFGKESNWATKEEFKTSDEAMDWAKKNSLKVVNPPK